MNHLVTNYEISLLQWDLNTGMEHRVISYLHLRTGFFYEDPDYGNRKFITFGAGIRYDIYGFDFSYITTSVFKGGENHPLSDTLRFTVSIGWDAVPESTRGLPRGI